RRVAFRLEPQDRARRHAADNPKRHAFDLRLDLARRLDPGELDRDVEPELEVGDLGLEHRRVVRGVDFAQILHALDAAGEDPRARHGGKYRLARCRDDDVTGKFHGDWISIRKPPGHIPALIGNGAARWCYHHTMIRGSWRLAPAGAVATRPSDFWRARDRAGTARGIRGTADEAAGFQLMILGHLTDGKNEPFNLIGDFGILRLRRAFIHAAEGAGDLRNAALLVDVDLSDIATVRKLKELLPKRHEASIWIFACDAGNR